MCVYHLHKGVSNSQSLEISIFQFVCFLFHKHKAIVVLSVVGIAIALLHSVTVN
jgi:hypothetical protein